MRKLGVLLYRNIGQEINMGRIVTRGISYGQNYLGTEINSERKINREINRRIQNASKFYHIKKGIL